MPAVPDYADFGATQRDLIKLIKTRGADLVAATLSELITQSGGSVDQDKLEQTLNTYQAKPPFGQGKDPVQEIRRIVKEELRRFNF